MDDAKVSSTLARQPIPGYRFEVLDWKAACSSALLAYLGQEVLAVYERDDRSLLAIRTDEAETAVFKFACQSSTND